MATKIEFEFEGVDYTLVFTRKSIQTMEKQGFRPEDVSSMPATMMPMLFRGAFLAHHRNVKADVVDRIFTRLNDVEDGDADDNDEVEKSELFQTLAEMYNEPLEALANRDGGEKNISWRKTT